MQCVAEKMDVLSFSRCAAPASTAGHAGSGSQGVQTTNTVNAKPAPGPRAGKRPGLGLKVAVADNLPSDTGSADVSTHSSTQLQAGQGEAGQAWWEVARQAAAGQGTTAAGRALQNIGALQQAPSSSSRNAFSRAAGVHAVSVSTAGAVPPAAQKQGENAGAPGNQPAQQHMTQTQAASWGNSSPRTAYRRLFNEPVTRAFTMCHSSSTCVRAVVKQPAASAEAAVVELQPQSEGCDNASDQFVSLPALGIRVACLTGVGGRKAQEDRCMLMTGLKGRAGEDCCAMAVFDGHGGTAVSTCAAEKLPAALLTAWAPWQPGFCPSHTLRTAFSTVDSFILQQAAAAGDKAAETVLREEKEEGVRMQSRIEHQRPALDLTHHHPDTGGAHGDGTGGYGTLEPVSSPEKRRKVSNGCVDGQVGEVPLYRPAQDVSMHARGTGGVGESHRFGTHADTQVGTGFASSRTAALPCTHGEGKKQPDQRTNSHALPSLSYSSVHAASTGTGGATTHTGSSVSQAQQPLAPARALTHTTASVGKKINPFARSAASRLPLVSSGTTSPLPLHHDLPLSSGSLALEAAPPGLVTALPHLTGTTALLMVLERDGQERVQLHVAHVGDSRAVLISTERERGGGGGDEGGRGTTTVLTEDHRPSLAREAQRVAAMGGLIADGRLAGLLAVTRSLGDAGLRFAGLSPVPDVSTWQLPPLASSPARPLACVLATDGLWDALSNELVGDIVLSSYQPTSVGLDVNIAAHRLAAAASIAGSRDNITIIVLDLAPANTHTEAR